MLASALLIFVMRITDITLYTMRIMMVVRGRKKMAWMFAFCQSVVFVTAMRAVLTGTDNWMNVIGYAAGFATGNVVGIWLENRLAIGHTHLRIISRGCGEEIAEVLRQAGYAVTEIYGHGRSGTVAILNLDVMRREVATVTRLTEQCDLQAFITTQAVRPVQRGFWRKA